MEKTSEMELMELRDWRDRVQRDPAARQRDIREIIQDAVDTQGTLGGAAERLGVNLSTLSKWISERLDGDVQSRVVFPGFDPAAERDAEPTPTAA